MTIFSVTKYVVPLLTSAFILVLVYCCFDEISDLEESDNIPGGTFAKEKRKFVTILSENNETVRTVYVDNDNMDDIEILPNDYLTKKIPSDVTAGDPVSSYYQSSSMGIENPYSIEWDETIDYDYHGKFAKQERNSSTDIRDKTKTRIVLVQENYHSNDAITNIMYRYGVLNQLTFALPKKSTFQEYWPLRFHPSFVDNSLTFSSHVDMLVNPTHQYETLKRFMPKNTVFIAVLHDPVASFYSKLTKHPLLRKFKLHKRLKIVESLAKRSKHFRDKYMNPIASEFGSPRTLENHNATSEEIIQNIQTQFDFVLIGSYLDESLVVLKNTLNWSISDVADASEKRNMDYGNIPAAIRDEVKEYKTLDQAIYKHFNNTFWKTIKSYESAFSSDLKELRRLNGKLESYCKWPIQDSVCTTMKRGDKDYVTYLKAKYQNFTNTQLNSGLLHLKSSLEFYFNTTSKEIQRYLDSQ